MPKKSLDQEPTEVKASVIGLGEKEAVWIVVDVEAVGLVDNLMN